MLAIGKRIRDLRAHRGLSQGDIERSTGMVRAYISRVEHGRTIPSIESIVRFAGALDVPVHEMFRESSDNGKVARASKAGEEFVSLFSGYIRKMNNAERDLLMDIAKRLARGGQK